MRPAVDAVDSAVVNRSHSHDRRQTSKQTGVSGIASGIQIRREREREPAQVQAVTAQVGSQESPGMRHASGSFRRRHSYSHSIPSQDAHVSCACLLLSSLSSFLLSFSPSPSLHACVSLHLFRRKINKDYLLLLLLMQHHDHADDDDDGNRDHNYSLSACPLLLLSFSCSHSHFLV